MVEKSEEQLLSELFGASTTPKKKKNAWRHLYNRYFHDIHNHINRISQDKEACKDVIHDTWIAIIDRNIKIRDPKAFRSYLLTTARNKFLNGLKNRRWKHVTLEDMEIEDKSKDSLGKVLDREMIDHLQKLTDEVLKRYPKDKKEMILEFLENPEELRKIVKKYGDRYSEANIYKTVERFKKQIIKRITY